MKFYKLENQGMLPYPVGLYISEAITFVNNVYDTIKTNNIFKKHYTIFIWCRGSSGALLAGLLAQKLSSDIATDYDVKVCYVRKPGEKTHNQGKYGNYIGCYEKPYNIIIDDFVARGLTLYSILLAMRDDGVKNVDALILSDVDGVIRKSLTDNESIEFFNIIIPKVLICNITGIKFNDNILRETEKLRAQSIKTYLTKCKYETQ